MRAGVAIASSVLAAGALVAMACGSSIDAPPPYPSSPAPSNGADSGTSGGTSGTSGTSGGTSGTSGTPGVGTTATAFCSGLLGGLFIDVPERCCSAAEKAAPSYAGIKMSYQDAVAQCTSDLEPSVTSGRAHVDAAALAACTTAIKAQACKGRNVTSLELLGSCASAVSGKQALGAPCRDSTECVSGTSCVGFTRTAEGTCQTPAIGAACGPLIVDGGTAPDFAVGNKGAQCASGGVCTNGTCVAGKPSGAACKSGECAPPLFCKAGTCAATQSDVGGACLGIGDCKQGLYCTSPSFSSVPGTCQTEKSAGSPCAANVLNECEGACTVPDGGTTGTCSVVCGSN